ncbi:putative ankyrin repeat-containing domain-containing protein [Rosa chinensis]|uniref:Putative ankyrin repeat-containing domain-containing protein n=1 Tax=Rosa chinensis TaxID=74649 RepID=A0A2P6PIQ8_ROSCH|nr:putative ankyrin repeat-containing domain-containing protein [Rosa chinensis]
MLVLSIIQYIKDSYFKLSIQFSLCFYVLFLFYAIGIYIREVVHVNIPDISIHVAESIEDHSNERDFISSVMSLYRRFAESPYIFCGIHGIYQMKSTHKWIFQFLHCMGEATRIYNLTADQLDMVKKSIFTAIEQGHHEFVTQLCEVNPKLLWDTCDESGMTIFHFAIRYRQEEVFNLIYGLEEEKQNDIGIRLVNSDKSMLHFAADLFLVPYLDHIQDASLQMQRELQWFKVRISHYTHTRIYIITFRIKLLIK